MRYFLTIAFTALAISSFGGGSFAAEALNGEQIKKLLVGNTLYREYYSKKKRRARKMWLYIKSPTEHILHSERETKRGWKDVDQNRPQRITNDGMICWQTYGRGVNTEACRNNLRLKGDILRMSGVGGMKGRKWKILKGNPKGL